MTEAQAVELLARMDNLVQLGNLVLVLVGAVAFATLADLFADFVGGS